MNLKRGSGVIYLDNHATTRLADEARNAMLDAWRCEANASSDHAQGQLAAQMVDLARRQVAALIDASPAEIIFTSGATEGNNIVLLGVPRALKSRGETRNEIIISAVEHKAVVEPARALEREGFLVKVVSVNEQGVVDLRHLSQLIGEKTLLVSVMAASNESGVIQPIAEVALLTHAVGAYFHTDATQAVGRIPLSVLEMEIDYLTCSAHKLHGPCGVGGIFISAGAPRPRPIQYGGAQEEGLRPGTVPVPLVVGFGVAAEIAAAQLEQSAKLASELATQFLKSLISERLPLRQLCNEVPRLPGSCFLSLEGIDSDQLIQLLASTVCISTGSACNSGQIGPSPAVQALCLPPLVARGAFRVCFSRYNTSAEAKAASQLIAEGHARLLIATG